MGIKLYKKHSLSVAVLSVLIAVIVLFGCGCSDNKNDTATNDTAVSTVENAVQEIGEGETSFTFEVENGDEKSTFDVKTDKTTVGDALLELNLIAGDKSDYGLYVKTVNGVTADYDKDGTYWAFYINGEYALTGVDSTEITDGAVYKFRVEK